MAELKKLVVASNRALQFFVKNIGSDGQLTPAECKKDLSFYYKLPTFLLVGGQYELAHRVMDYVQKNFNYEGDLRTSADTKSSSFALKEFYKYADGWLYMASMRLGRFDVAWPVQKQLEKYYIVMNTNQIGTNSSSGALSDIFMAAHYGMTWMFNQNKSLGTCQTNRAVEQIANIITSQPNLDEFFLRIQDGKLVTEFPAEMSAFYVIKRKVPKQLYFMLGYPILFLAKMHETGYTGHDVLNLAGQLLEFCRNCHESIYSFHFAHKVALGASLVAKIIKSEEYYKLALRIAENLLTQQSETGLFLPEADAQDQYDQSAEIGLWLREISANLQASGI